MFPAQSQGATGKKDPYFSHGLRAVAALKLIRQKDS
jgi:hypothetical protein